MALIYWWQNKKKKKTTHKAVFKKCARTQFACLRINYVYFENTLPVNDWTAEWMNGREICAWFPTMWLPFSDYTHTQNVPVDWKASVFVYFYYFPLSSCFLSLFLSLSLISIFFSSRISELKYYTDSNLLEGKKKLNP